MEHAYSKLKENILHNSTDENTALDIIDEFNQHILEVAKS